MDVETITVTKSLLSTIHYNYTALSTTHTGGEATPFLPFQKDLYYSTILIEPTKTAINIDSQKLVTYPSLSTTDQIERDCSRAVTTREAVVWALLSLVTLLFIGLLSVNATVICIQKCRQNKAHAPAYEMAGNPCYESSKINNTLETEIYESIETERVYV